MSIGQSFRRLKINQRLLLIAGLSSLGVAVVAGVGLANLKRATSDLDRLPAMARELCEAVV